MNFNMRALRNRFTKMLQTRALRPLSLFVCFFSLSGCLTVGSEFPTSVKWIEIGKTDKNQIKTKIGDPFRKGYDSGMLTYTYGFYRYSLFRPTRTKDLTVRFNDDGTVQSYTFASSFDEDKSALDKN